MTAPETPHWFAWDGNLSELTGSYTMFTAPDYETAPLVGVTVRDVMLHVPFSVLKPSDILYAKYGGDKHLQEYTSAGFLAAMQLQPTSVSFYAVQIKEDSAPTINATGLWTNAAGHPNGSWNDVSDDNTVQGLDQVASKYPTPGAAPGGYTWAIPLRYRVSSGDGYQFKTLNHIFNADSNGTATQSKHGVNTAPIPLNAATDWPF